VRVLVTGGAGYIGAHLVRVLADRGDYVLVVDDLVAGYQERIPGIPLVKLDLTDESAVAVLTEEMTKHRIDAIVHLAARKSVIDSMEQPLWYYRQNLGGLIAVLDAATAVGVRRIVFSSSASVYGDASGVISEDGATVPISPYGSTKLLGEQMVADVARASDLSAISLRYFNVAGCGAPELGDRIAANLVPMVFERLDADDSPRIFGDDYDTPDGTCVRDYVHVLDLAEAHLAALDHLDTAADPHRVYNVGTGVGTSVREMIDVILAEANSTLVPAVLPRRPGDSADVVATVDRIRLELGWSSRHSLVDIVRSAWQSHEYFASL
jgi:UDP-glucose 4-epimerase